MKTLGSLSLEKKTCFYRNKKILKPKKNLSGSKLGCSLIQMNSSQIGKLATLKKKEKKISKRSKSEKLIFFKKNRKKFSLPNNFQKFKKNDKIQKMRLKASRTFDKTCVNLFKVKDTLRNHSQYM